MSITSSGPKCDVCGNYILNPEDRVNFFRIEGIEEELICDNKCKEDVLRAEDNWRKLPKGPLRQAFENSYFQTQIWKCGECGKEHHFELSATFCCH
jgi:hypothetical protein